MDQVMALRNEILYVVQNLEQKQRLTDLEKKYMITILKDAAEEMKQLQSKPRGK